MAYSKMGGRKVKIWLILLIIIGVVVSGTLIALLADAPERRELQTIAIGNIDFTKLQDGTYVGEYAGTKGSSRNATVKVTILDGQISGINILKGALDSDRHPAELTGGMTIEDLFERVMKSESLQVDVISGATLTSKAHLKALENALKQAQKQ
jgi:uncharacterized protein with FMN-binding domain